MQCLNMRILVTFEPLNELTLNFSETYKCRFQLQLEYSKYVILIIYYYTVNIFTVDFFFYLEKSDLHYLSKNFLVNAEPLEAYLYSLSKDEK